MESPITAIEETEFHKWRKNIVKNYNFLILFQTTIIFLIPFIFVLIEAIYYPGFIYCSDTSCPSSVNPPVPDIAALIVGKFFIFFLKINSKYDFLF